MNLRCSSPKAGFEPTPSKRACMLPDLHIVERSWVFTWNSHILIGDHDCQQPRYRLTIPTMKELKEWRRLLENPWAGQEGQVKADLTNFSIMPPTPQSLLFVATLGGPRPGFPNIALPLSPCPLEKVVEACPYNYAFRHSRTSFVSTDWRVGNVGHSITARADRSNHLPKLRRRLPRRRRTTAPQRPSPPPPEW